MQEFSENGLDYLGCYVENVADFGYYIADVDQNGTEELLLGVLAEVTPGYTGMFYDLYTMEDGNLVQIITSGERDRYYLCEDNTIANEGSGSAWTSSYAYYDLVGNQLYIKELVRFDAYYDENNPWFYSAAVRPRSDLLPQWRPARSSFCAAAAAMQSYSLLPFRLQFLQPLFYCTFCFCS